MKFNFITCSLTTSDVHACQENKSQTKDIPCGPGVCWIGAKTFCLWSCGSHCDSLCRRSLMYLALYKDVYSSSASFRRQSFTPPVTDRQVRRTTNCPFDNFAMSSPNIPIPFAIIVPIVQGYADGIRPAFPFILISAVFSAMLVPLLFLLFAFSTARTRQSPVFVLNVAAVSLGIIVGILSNHLTVSLNLCMLTMR